MLIAGQHQANTNFNVQLSMADVRLAIQAKTEQSLNTPAPREVR